jgi:AmmeMemoRadiSam system protein A
MAISTDARTVLLRVARAAMEAAVTRQRAPQAPDGVAVDAFGVFVTIHHHGELRGCLGSLDCRAEIVPSIIRLAAAVTREDYRFSPLQPHELAGTAIDLSLLTIPEPVEDVAGIEIGRHGLIVEKGNRRGLLLPQVAPEHGWDRDAFLAHT